MQSARVFATTQLWIATSNRNVLAQRLHSTCNPIRHLNPSSSVATRRSATMHVHAMSADEDFISMIKQKNTQNGVVVYSKTYCPYCQEVSQLFNSLNIPAKTIQLDQLADEQPVFNALKKVTGRSTVPQVFIGGELVGGCDDTMAAYKSGRLRTLLEGVGVTFKE